MRTEAGGQCFYGLGISAANHISMSDLAFSTCSWRAFTFTQKIDTECNEKDSFLFWRSLDNLGETTTVAALGLLLVLDSAGARRAWAVGSVLSGKSGSSRLARGSLGSGISVLSSGSSRPLGSSLSWGSVLSGCSVLSSRSGGSSGSSRSGLSLSALSVLSRASRLSRGTIVSRGSSISSGSGFSWRKSICLRLF